MVKNILPEKGDIVLVDLNPTRGHEQAGFRPVVVLSNVVFNDFTKMMLVCPISSNEKEFPTHYILKNSQKVRGAVLCEHIRSIDYSCRKIKFVEKTDPEDLLNIIMLSESFID